MEGLVESSWESFQQALAELLKYCGELALATETSMTGLQDVSDETEEEEEAQVKVSQL